MGVDDHLVGVEAILQLVCILFVCYPNSKMNNIINKFVFCKYLKVLLARFCELFDTIVEFIFKEKLLEVVQTTNP